MFTAEADIQLSQNQKLVMRVLETKAAPLSAYMILEELRAEGLKAPLQVYRALEKLMAYGLVHRLESLNAFIACSHMSCESTGASAFVICDKCEQVQEICDESVSAFLSGLAEKSQMKATKSSIELHGLCTGCAGG